MPTGLETRAYSDLLTRTEAAAYIGVQVTTLETWASTGRYGIPFIKVGRLAKYRRADLDRWLESRTVNAVEAE